MDIFDDEALRRPVSFPLNLRRLPRELMHNVLDNLPLKSVLQILSHKHELLDNGVKSHLAWGRFFNNSVDVDIVVDLFILYSEIHRFFTRENAVLKPLCLDCSVQRIIRFHFKIESLKDDLSNAINGAIPTGGRSLAILRLHTDRPEPLSNASLRERWEWVKGAKRNANKAKFLQMSEVADLLKEFPGKLMLKTPHDPFQGPPRDNLKHVEDGIRWRARKALHNRDVKVPNVARRCARTPGIDNIELVPYDRYLVFFFNVLKQYPTERYASKNDFVAEETPGDDNTNVSAREDFSSYPEPISTALKEVLSGLNHVYTGPSQQPVIDRIRWIDGQPRFHIEDLPHGNNLATEYHKCGISKLTPCDEREYRWLRSFLKVVTWMEAEFGSPETQLDSNKPGEENSLVVRIQSN